MGRSSLMVSAVAIVTVTGCQAVPVPLSPPTEPPTEAPANATPAQLSAYDTAPPLPSRTSIAPFVTDQLSRYLATTDAITSRGGADPDEMAEAVTQDWLVEEHRGFAEFERQGIRTIGTTRNHEVLVQSVRERADGDLEVTVFSCVDTRSVWVVPGDAPEPPEGLEQWLDDGSPAPEDDEEFPASWQDYIATVAPRPGGLDPVLWWFRGPDEQDLRLDFTDTWRGHHPCNEE